MKKSLRLIISAFMALFALMESKKTWAAGNEATSFKKSKIHSANKSRGVFLIVHGLNNKPDVMVSIANWLEKNEYDTILVALSGHRGEPLEKLYLLTCSQWIKDIDEALIEYKKEKFFSKSEKEPLRINLAAFSLGALVSLNYIMDHQKQISVGKMLLFAPAIYPRFYVNLLRSLSFFSHQLITSRGPENYRANPELPIAMYNSLFECMDRLNKSNLRGLQTPTTVFMDPLDELLSFKDTNNLVKQISQWKMVPITNKDSRLANPYHHLVIDEKAVGSTQWQSMLREFTLQLNTQ